MCGIVGYVGTQECAPILVEGLRRLEYRGYDSAGLALHTGPKGIEIVRAVGKLANLEVALKKNPLAGTTGIGHTRWATHGRPSEANAHPHVAGRIAVVHNGIIENHVALRRELEGRGVRFASDTDTEIVAHLIEEEVHGGHPLAAAVRNALRRVRGAYAIAVLSADSPEEVVVAKADSPLVIGIGKGEMLCASDIPALLAHTRDVVFLDDGEVARLTRTAFEITKLDGSVVQRAAKRIDWSATQAEKGGYKHFMLKEIHEQPRAVEDTLRGRVDLVEGDVIGEELGISADLAKKIRRVYFVACGTSAHAAMAGRYWVEQLARVPAVVEIASEVRYREPVLGPDDLVVAVSQSGETLDTLAALKAAKARGANILAVANVIDSAIPRHADAALYTHAGPEIGVASTKCFTTQLVAMVLLAVYLGRRRGTLPADEARRVLDALTKAPQQMRDVLAKADDIRYLAKKYVHANHMLFLGRGTGYPVALEGALKLKEISYIHAEGYAAGEMKHGPIALIDDEMPVVALVPRDAHYEKTVSNMQEVRAREGQIIAVCTRGDKDVRAMLLAGLPPGSSRRASAPPPEPDIVEIPAAEPEVLPLLEVIPLQLLAYDMADLKGNDVDQPRNLAKTVTVE